MASFFEVFARALLLVYIFPVWLDNILVSNKTCKWFNHTTFWCSAEQYLNDILFSIVSPQFVQKCSQNGSATTTRLEILAARLSTSSASRLAPFIFRVGRCLLPISVALVVPFALNALALLEFARPGVVCAGVDWHGERLHARPDWVGRTKRCDESLVSLANVKGVDVEQRRRFAEAFVIRAIKNLTSFFDPGEMFSAESKSKGKPTARCMNQCRRLWERFRIGTILSYFLLRQVDKWNIVYIGYVAYHLGTCPCHRVFGHVHTTPRGEKFSRSDRCIINVVWSKILDHTSISWCHLSP